MLNEPLFSPKLANGPPGRGWDRPLVLAYAAIWVLTYTLLHNNYRPADVDDGWLLSFHYNFVNQGIDTDVCFGDPANGVKFFGKVYSFLAGSLFNAVGWTRTNGHLLSMFLMGCAVLLWARLLRKLGQSGPLALGFTCTVPLLDPFFTAATSNRMEAWVFLLTTAAMSLLASGRPFWAMVAAWLALESHPMGIMAFFYMASVPLSSRSHRSSLTRGPALLGLVGGALLGAAVLSFLHWEVLTRLPALLGQKNDPADLAAYGPLYDYFFLTKYLRHLPELALFLLAGLLYWRDGLHRRETFPWVFLACSLAAALLVHRPNFHYAVYFYPALWLMVLRVFEAKGKLTLLMAGLLLYLLPQYLWVLSRNHAFDFDLEVRAVRELVPEDGLPVVGGPNGWFSFHHRTFHHYGYMGEYERMGLERFHLVTDPDYPVLGKKMALWMEGRFRPRTTKTLEVGGRLFQDQLMEATAGPSGRGPSQPPVARTPKNP